MRRPMISLTVSVAILDKLTRRTCLETSAPLFAAVGTTDNVDLVHLPHRPFCGGVKDTKSSRFLIVVGCQNCMNCKSHSQCVNDKTVCFSGFTPHLGTRIWKLPKLCPYWLHLVVLTLTTHDWCIYLWLHFSSRRKHKNCWMLSKLIQFISTNKSSFECT
jgi:hypothetical protein